MHEDASQGTEMNKCDISNKIRIWLVAGDTSRSCKWHNQLSKKATLCLAQSQIHMQQTVADHLPGKMPRTDNVGSFITFLSSLSAKHTTLILDSSHRKEVKDASRISYTMKAMILRSLLFLTGRR